MKSAIYFTCLFLDKDRIIKYHYMLSDNLFQYQYGTPPPPNMIDD